MGGGLSRLLQPGAGRRPSGASAPGRQADGAVRDAGGWSGGGRLRDVLVAVRSGSSTGRSGLEEIYDFGGKVFAGVGRERVKADDRAPSTATRMERRLS